MSLVLPSSPQLSFRVWKLEDLPLAVSLWGRSEVTALIGGPFTEDECVARLRCEMTMHDEFGVQYWPIFITSTGDFVGCCGLRPIRNDNQESSWQYELGFHLLPEFWRRGLAFEAAQAVIHFARAQNMPAIHAGHHPKNEASRGLLLKLGFEYNEEKYYEPTGLVHPSYILQL